MEWLQYDFMQRALVAGLLIAITAPCIGVILVLKRLSAVGEATGHSSLAGIAFGMIMGWDPLVGAVVFSIAAVFFIELLRKRFRQYADLAPMIVLSAGIGLTAVLSRMVHSGGTNLSSFMFGSVVTITDAELCLTAVLSVLVITLSILLYRPLFYMTFDEDAAQIAGIPMGKLNFIFMLLTAVTVSAASRTVGALMAVSLLVIPVACGMIIGRSYKKTFLWSVGFAEIFTVGGLILSYYLDWPPGGAIVLLGVAVLILIMSAFVIKRQ